MVCLISLLSLVGSKTIAQSYEVQHVSLPLKGSIFSPVIYDSLLVVCSDQKDRIYHTVLDQNNKEPVDLYVVHPSNVNFQERFNERFRTSFHDGPIAFNAAKNFIAVSRNLKTDINFKYSVKGENLLGIYFSTKYGNNWSDIEPFDYNDPNYSITHPTLDKKGTTLFFTSNMPGGYGGYDIYKSTWDRDKWTKPINLGPKINTQNDEVFPSLIDNKIYFSSNKTVHGGLDIYVFNLSDSSLSVLDTTINSAQDDFGMVSSNFGESGYFSSNRSGTDQVYSFEFKYPEFQGCDSIVETYFCYTLEDEYALELSDNSGLVYVWNVDEKQLFGTSVDYCFEETGDYEITLDIIDTVVNQTFYEQSYIYLSIQYEQQPYINCPDTVKVGEKFTINADKTYLPYFDIKAEDHYWLIDDSINKRGFEIQHSFDAEGLYKIQLGVIGTDQGQEVTDCSYKYVVCGNPVLAVDTMNQNLLAVNNDQSDQINVNTEETQYANPEDSASFYTIEIIVTDEILPEDDLRLKLLDGHYDYRLSYIPEKEIYIYHIGDYEEMDEAHKDWRDLKQLGLDDAILKSMSYSDGMFELNELFVLKNVNFESAKWDILEESKPDLKKVIDVLTLLKDFNVQINAHTDNTASDAYNLALSNKRANSIKNYLIAHGIDTKRISTQGFGESQPIATNDTEVGKAQNRRVEFKLVKPKLEQ